MNWRWVIVGDLGEVTGTNDESLAQHTARLHVVIDMQKCEQLLPLHDITTSAEIPEEDPTHHIDPETRRFYE